VPTAPTHAIAALALGAGFHRPGVPRDLWAVGALFAMLPDIDVIGFRFGIRYGDPLGHRGLTHSLTFAAALAAVAVLLRNRRGAGPLGPWAVWTFLTLATASHGLLDMLTDGGHGIALLAPWDTTRYFWPVRPVAVSPIGLQGLIDWRMGRVMATELIWIWSPALLLALLLRAANRARRTLPD
jgi:inner membrane protein